MEKFDFKNTDIVISSPGSEVSKVYVPKATKAGAVVIDNTSYFRMEKDIPLIVPEVNPKEISKFKKKENYSKPKLLYNSTCNCS